MALSGGCLCGAIRYEIDRVFDVETQLGWLVLADDLPRVSGNTLPHPDRR
jgi:hypothetical protein